MSSIEVDLIPTVWLLVSAAGSVVGSNLAARSALVGVEAARSWDDWVAQSDVDWVARELAALKPGGLWQGGFGLRAARPAGRWAARIACRENQYSILLIPPAEQVEAVPLGEFLARFAHDVRAPLAAVRSGLFLLGRHGQAVQGQREQKWLGAASQSLAGLETLLHGVESLTSVLTAPAAAAPVGNLAARQELLNLISELQQGGSDGRIRLDWPVEVPAHWRLPADLWVAALRPILANALRHASLDTPACVRVRVVPDGLGIDVEDGGPGVQPSEESRLFRPFFHSRNVPERGVGLGLVIAQVAARGLGGEVTYSRVGGRTVFALRVRGMADGA